MSTSRPSLCELHSYCNDLRRQEKFCDVIIKVENRTFPCHRIILASALEYFRSMFSGNYNEATQKEVELKGIEADDFELLLNHLYGGSVTLNENVFRLLRISNYVGLRTLSNLCEQYIIENKEKIPLSTILDVFELASKLENHTLVNALSKRLAQNFVTIAKDEKLFWISKTELDSILSQVDMAQNRMVTLDFLLYWANYHPADVNMFDSLLKKLNLPNDLYKWFVDKLKNNVCTMTVNDKDENEAGNGQSIVEKEPLFYNESIFYKKFCAIQPNKIRSPTISLYCRSFRQAEQGPCEYKASEYEFNAESNSLGDNERNFNFDSNTGLERIEFSKFVSIAERVQLVFLFRTDAGFYTIIPYLYDYCGSKKRLSHYVSVKIKSSACMAVCGTNAYFYNDDEFLMFNAEMNRWTPLIGNEPLRTMNASILSYQNNLYMLGGHCSESTALTTCASKEYKKIHILENGKIFQRYDPREGTWSRFPYMTHYRNGLSSCVHGDVLYVTGGENLSYHEGFMECYDFKACKWRVFERKVPKPLQNHIVIGYNDQLYFLDRDNISNSTWYWYNLKDNIWSDVYSMQKEHGENETKYCVARIWDAEVKM